MARHVDLTDAPDGDLTEPRHATAWAALVYAVFTMALGYAALAGKFLVNARSDQYIAGFAFRDFAAQSLKAGHGIPQWNPYLQGGLPYIAAMHGDIFYPTALLRWILPTDVAMTWEFIIHLFLCGLFTYLFLRAWGFGFWSALLGGAAYMLGGSIAGYASPGHDGKLFVSTMLPALLLSLTRGIRDGRAWAWGAIAVVVGLALLSPHPQLSQYLLLTGGAFALYVAFAEVPGHGKLLRNVALTRIGFALGAVALGMLASAIQYLPVMQYTPWSPRTGGHDWAAMTSYSFPIEETLNWYWPQFSGILDGYWGRNGVHLHSDFFGVVVLMLAGASFGASSRKSFHRFWIGTGIVSLLWAYGGFTPLYHVIAAIVPGTKYFRAPSTMIFVTAFSVAMLVAVGAERLFARRMSIRYPLGWTIAAGVFGLLMTVGGYRSLVSMVGSMMSTDYPEQVRGQVVDMIVQRAEPNAASAILGVWRSFAFVALTAGLLWLFLQRRVASKQLAIGLVVLLAVDLWSIERMYWIFSPPASVLYATDPAIEAIKADIARTGQPGRVINPPVGAGLASWMGRPDRAFSGDILMIHGLRLDQGYHGNELGMYQQLVSLDSGQIRISPQFWRHENVRYWYAALDDSTMQMFASQLKIPVPVKLAGPVRNATGSMVYAYKLPGDNPFAFVSTAMTKAPQNQALATVIDARFDPATVAIVDTTAKDINPPAVTTLPAPASTRATVSAYAPGAIDIALDQPGVAGQALVVSENYYPGWHATVDGKAAPVALMNYNLIGVALPAGAKSIQLRFTDAAYEKGKLITWVAGLLAVALWIAGAVVERRRSDPAIVTP
jgi:hypothetical protein